MKNLIKVNVIALLISISTLSCEAPEENEVIENENVEIKSSEEFLIEKSKVTAPGGK